MFEDIESMRREITEAVSEAIAGGPESASRLAVSILSSAGYQSQMLTDHEDGARGDYIANVGAAFVQAGEVPLPGAGRAQYTTVLALIDALAVAAATLHALHCPAHEDDEVPEENSPAEQLRRAAATLEDAYASDGRDIAEEITAWADTRKGIAAAVEQAGGIISPADAAAMAEAFGFLTDEDDED